MKRAGGSPDIFASGTAVTMEEKQKSCNKLFKLLKYSTFIIG
jgi:hypothetical protein